MAKEPENPFEEDGAEDSESAGGLPTKVLIRIGLMVAVLAIGSVGGYGVGSMLQQPPAADPNQAAAPPPEFAEEAQLPDITSEDYEYVDFEPITANLDEPRLARYIRATIILCIRSKDREVALERINKKKKELRNWLTVYLNGLTLEDVRGSKNLNRIRREIQEACNQQLWPKRRPLIDHVLFKEFAVQ